MYGQEDDDKLSSADGVKDVVRGGPGHDGIGTLDALDDVKGVEYYY